MLGIEVTWFFRTPPFLVPFLVKFSWWSSFVTNTKLHTKYWPHFNLFIACLKIIFAILLPLYLSTRDSFLMVWTISDAFLYKIHILPIPKLALFANLKTDNKHTKFLIYLYKASCAFLQFMLSTQPFSSGFKKKVCLSGCNMPYHMAEITLNYYCTWHLVVT